VLLAEIEAENPRWREFFRTVSSLPDMAVFARLLDADARSSRGDAV